MVITETPSGALGRRQRKCPLFPMEDLSLESHRQPGAPVTAFPTGPFLSAPSQNSVPESLTLVISCDPRLVLLCVQVPQHLLLTASVYSFWKIPATGAMSPCSGPGVSLCPCDPKGHSHCLSITHRALCWSLSRDQPVPVLWMMTLEGSLPGCTHWG